MKTDLEAFPCGQAPRYVDDDVDMVQSNAIVRHLGRKLDMYGDGSLAAAAQVDMVIDTVEGIKLKYLELIYKQELADDAKAAYWTAHVDAATVHDRNGGTHFSYLDCMLHKRAGAGPFALGATLSVADIMAFDIFDAHLRIWGDALAAAFPRLAAHHKAVGEVPGIAAYLASDRRHPQQNGTPLG